MILQGTYTSSNLLNTMIFHNNYRQYNIISIHMLICLSHDHSNIITNNIPIYCISFYNLVILKKNSTFAAVLNNK